MDTYAALLIEDPGVEPFWTVVDLSLGEDLRDAHKFATKQEAEAMAEIMNGNLSGEVGQP
jgi:ribosome-binding factor A